MKYFLNELRELSIKELRELYFKYEDDYLRYKHPENSDQQLIQSKCLKGMQKCKQVIDEKNSDLINTPKTEKEMDDLYQSIKKMYSEINPQKIIIHEVEDCGLVKVIKSNGNYEYVIASYINKTPDGKIDYWGSGAYFGTDFKSATKKYFNEIEGRY